MDSVSQFALGASVAELFFGRRLGNKALLWGGILGTLPDLDVIPGKWMSELDSVAFHRGPSHSLIFCILLVYPIAWLIRRCYRNKIDLNLHYLALCVFSILVTHDILDMCTTWGTKFLWPFSDVAIAWQIIFVADPLYTSPFLLAFVFILFLKRQSKWRFKINSLALILSTSYLIICLGLKMYIHNHFERAFATSSEPVQRWSSRPAPLTSLLWTANAETENYYIISYASIFDKGPAFPITYFEKNHQLRKQWQSQLPFQKLQSITQGQYLFKTIDHGIEISDLRFGQILGWTDPYSDFVFRYTIQQNNSNKELITKALKPNRQNLKDGLVSLWQRIQGIQKNASSEPTIIKVLSQPNK